MNIRIPPKLSPGDLIAITAPSSGVPEHLHPRLELAIQHLRNRGYQVIEGECLRQQFKNNLGMELLELIDFTQLAHLTPKWFVGFSDLSTFHFPLTTRCADGPRHTVQISWN